MSYAPGRSACFCLAAILLLASCTGRDAKNGDSATGGEGHATRLGASEVPEAISPEQQTLSFHRTNLEETFEAVARGIRFDPYTGILRGAEGTAVAGSGNSIDQSMLLKEAIADQVSAVRFAQGRLDNDRLATLLSSLSPSTDPTAGYDNGSRELYDPAADQNLQREVREHFWLEVQVDGDAWIALDPTFPGSSMGQAFADARKTFEEPTRAVKQVLTMTFLEENESGKVRRLGRITTPIVDLSLETIDFVVRAIPQYEAAAGSPSGAVGPGGIGNMLGGVTSGGDTRPSDEARDVEADEDRAIVGVQYRREVFVSGVSKPIAATMVEDGNESARVRREWIEFDLRAPGRQAKRFVRSLFDARAGKAMPAYRRYTISVIPARISQEVFRSELARVSVVSLDVWNQQLRQLQQDGISEETASTAFALESETWRETLRLVNLAFAAESDELTDRMAAAAGVTASRHAPRLLISSAESSVGVGGEVETMVRLDLRLDEVRAVPFAGMPKGVAPLFQRARGMLESALEGRVLARFSPDPSQIVTCETILREAQNSGVELALIVPDNRSVLATLRGLPVSDSERIEAALDAGRQIVIPTSAVEIGGEPRWGWWDVDPTTGAFVGVVEGGGHQAMSQYTVTLEEVGVNDDIGYVIGMLTGSTATATLYAAKMIEYGQVTEHLKQEIAQGIESLTCAMCPSIEVRVNVGAAAGFETDCLTYTAGFGYAAGVSGGVAFCENYKHGISCAASLMLNGLEIRAVDDVGPSITADMTPFSCN